MAAWHEEIIAGLDLETTGVDPLSARIVQAALVFVEPDGTINSGGWTGIVDPGVAIPDGATAVHGITTEMARLGGVQPADAVRQLAAVLDRIAERDIPLVIYNAPYDWPLLLTEARRHDVALRQVGIIDPLVCDRALDRYRRGSRRLEDVAQHYGHPLGNAHDAEADAIAAIAIARALATRYDELSEHTPDELQPMQTAWYAEWARSLSEYRGAPVDAGWPLPGTATHFG